MNSDFMKKRCFEIFNYEEFFFYRKVFYFLFFLLIKITTDLDKNPPPSHAFVTNSKMYTDAYVLYQNTT